MRIYTFTVFALAAVIGMSSCSSSKNAQNGPDMYSSGKTSGSDYVAAAPNDQYVQMKSQDYDRWSYFDDYNAYDAYYAPAPVYGGGFGYVIVNASGPVSLSSNPGQATINAPGGTVSIHGPSIALSGDINTAGSDSTCPKSGLIVASSVRFEATRYLKSPPAVTFERSV